MQFLTFLIAIVTTTFLDFKYEMEELAKQIAQKFEDQYPSQTSCQPLKQALYLKQCSGIISQTCSEDFPMHNDCYVKGVKLSDSIGYRVPKKKFQFMSCEEIKFMRASNECQEFFENTIKPQRNKRFSKIYLASNTGIFASHPSSTGQQCQDYDPRNRPWYVASSTASKNIVIVLKLKAFQQRAESIGIELIKTMNVGDWSIIVDLNNCSSTQCFPVYKSTTLQRNLSLLSVKASPAEWQAQDYTLMKQKTKQFFEFVNNSTMNVIVIVTDQSMSISSLETALKDIPSYKPKLIPIIIGNHPNNQLLKSLACNFSGLFIEDKMEYQAIDLLNPYAEYFSEGINLRKARWSTLYDDIFGFGTLATVTYPIQINNKLIGIVGIDIVQSYIQEEFGLQPYESQAQLVSLQIYGPVDRSHFCNIQNLPEDKIDVSLSWTSGENEGGVCCIPEQQLQLILILTPISAFLFIGLIVMFCRKLCRWVVIRKYRNPPSGDSDASEKQSKSQ